MRQTTLESLKDGEIICSNGEYVLVFGKYLWLFRTDGFFLCKFKNIRRPSKVAFLPGNKALIDGCGDGFYHYITLDTGEILWSSVQKGRRSNSSNHFAVSKDGTIVYDVCYVGNGILQIDQLYPQSQKHNRYTVVDGLRVTRDIFCDSEDVLCVVQTELIINVDDPYSFNSPPVWRNGIMAIPIIDTGTSQYWKKQWNSDGREYVSIRGGNEKYILFEDFSVLNLDSMEKFNLLQNTCHIRVPKEGFSWNYDNNRKLLTVWYIGERQNIIIDCQKRKVVAVYCRDNSIYGYGGCLVGNEYWTGTSSGIIRKPFPCIEKY